MIKSKEHEIKGIHDDHDHKCQEITNLNNKIKSLVEEVEKYKAEYADL